MKTPHFFKAVSRIGLTHPPVRQTEFNYGVEDGSTAILNDKFISKYSSSRTDTFIFSDPEKLDPETYIKTLVKELTEFKELINTTLKPEELQVVVGGDNTVTFSSFWALLERVKSLATIGFIQFDSHGESNSFSGSDSKNFHGMYMRPFFDEFDIELVEQLIPKKLQPDQAFFIGDQVLDGDEPEFFQKNKWQSLKYQDYLSNKSKYQIKLKDFVRKFENIHINFDIDVFHRSEAGATGIPEDGKWFKQEIFELLKIIKSAKSISIDISEINPQKEGAQKTIKLSQQILESLLNP